MAFGLTPKEKFSHYWERIFRAIHDYRRTPESRTNIAMACRNLEEFSKELAQHGYDEKKAEHLLFNLQGFRQNFSKQWETYDSRQQVAARFLEVVVRPLGISSLEEMRREIEERTLIRRLAA